MILRNAVSPAVVAAARGLINEGLGKGINKKDYHMRLKPDGTPTVDFCPELHTHPALLALFAQSGAPKLVESVLGLGAFHAGAHMTFGGVVSCRGICWHDLIGLHKCSQSQIESYHDRDSSSRARSSYSHCSRFA